MSSNHYTKYIDYLKNIPPFAEEAAALQKKYESLGSDKLDAFYVDFLALDKKIREWMKLTYPVETKNRALFYDNGRNEMCIGMRDSNNPQYIGLDAWIVAETRPSPHGGFPGAQWAWDTSVMGRISALAPVLQRAYQICKEENDKKVQAKNKRLEKSWEKKDKRVKQREARELARIESMKKKIEFEKKKLVEKIKQKYVKYIELLKDSLSMHYFPARMENGVRRPDEWLPDFNQELSFKITEKCIKLYTKLYILKREEQEVLGNSYQKSNLKTIDSEVYTKAGIILSQRIRKEAWNTSQYRRELLLVFHNEEHIRSERRLVRFRSINQ